jgi:hypothetical protein
MMMYGEGGQVCHVASNVSLIPRDFTKSHKISQSATVRRGHLKFAEEPLLSGEAQKLLAKEGVAAFEAAYGDYYVAGLTLGADCGICICFAQHDRSETEAWSFTVTVRFLFMSASHTWSEEKASNLADVRMTTLGYDSLTGKNLNMATQGQAGVQQLRAAAAELSAASESIGEELEARMRRLGLKDQRKMGISDLEGLHAAQVVVGLLLRPYKGLT